MPKITHEKNTITIQKKTSVVVLIAYKMVNDELYSYDYVYDNLHDDLTVKEDEEYMNICNEYLEANPTMESEIPTYGICKHCSDTFIAKSDNREFCYKGKSHNNCKTAWHRANKKIKIKD